MNEQKLLLLKKKILYKTNHRGSKENDLILGNYIATNIDLMSESELKQFSDLLDESDSDIFSWISNQKPIPEKWNNDMIAKIAKFSLVK